MAVLLFSQHRVAAGEHFEHWLTWWNGEGQGRAKPLGGTLLAAYEGSAQWTLLTAWADDAAAGAAVSLLQSAPAVLSTQALPLHGTPLAQWPREGYWRLALEEAGPGRWAGPRGTGCYVLDDGATANPWGFAGTACERWWLRPGSNRGPRHYECRALTS